MKQKYTLTVANSQINIVTEMSKDEIDSIVGIVDRRIREIHLHSRSCSRTDAAMLLCLDYCAEKIELQKTLKASNAQIDRLTVENELAQREISLLEREIETLRAAANIVASKPAPKKSVDEQLVIEPIIEEETPHEESAEEKSPNAVDKILEDINDTKEEATVLETEEHEKLHAKARKKKVRAMFDMISFDDI
jgi:cell division protein ZapA (FtsZ GTPase activity inhibitor)